MTQVRVHHHFPVYWWASIIELSLLVFLLEHRLFLFRIAKMFLESVFNVDNGYLEGLVRGFKCGIIKQTDYLNLVQCETLDDLKLHLQSTDYGGFLANEASPLSVSVIEDKLREKVVSEFQHIRNHAVEPLSTFLDFILQSYMIDNIILLITGMECCFT